MTINRVDAPPADCPRCNSHNGARGFKSGWVEYVGQDDYPMVGCTRCGLVFYLTTPNTSAVKPDVFVTKEKP